MKNVLSGAFFFMPDFLRFSSIFFDFPRLYIADNQFVSLCNNEYLSYFCITSKFKSDAGSSLTY